MTQRLDQEIFGGYTPPGGEVPGPPKRRVFSNLFALLLSLAVVLGGAYGAYRIAAPVITNLVATDDYLGPGSGDVEVVVADGDSGRIIAAKLVRAGVVKTSSAFVDATNEESDLAKKIQPGTYTLQREMRAADALAWLADPKNRSVKRVTIPEGLWASEVYERLSKASGIPIKQYQAAAKDTKALGLPKAANGQVEGWLFPSTYEFGPKASATEQLKTMVDQAVKVMTDEGIPQSRWEEVMIMASIIESEAGTAADRKKVARVFYNRLENPQGETVGLLQSDATVSYGAKRRAVAPTPQEKADADNAYNTHVHQGLPPGPISNPGQVSIDAAVKPATGPWYFFVTTNPDSGETKFAKTYAEHQRNTEEFLAWCAANDEKC